MAFVTTFEIGNRIYFFDARVVDMAQDLQVSNFIRGASSASCVQQIGVTKFVLHNPLSFDDYIRFAAFMFGGNFLDYKVLASCWDFDAVLRLKAAPAYHTNQDEKIVSLFQFLYSAVYGYVWALRALFSTIRPFNNEMFTDDGFTRFHAFEILLTSEVKTSVFNIFLYNMKLFICGSCACMKSEERQLLTS